MNYDMLIESDGESSTYDNDKFELLNIVGNSKRYTRIENAIADVENYAELISRYEIKQLDKNTKLKELKCQKIRIFHILYGDLFVFLGTIEKRTGKTPPTEIAKNNERIRKYKIQKKESTYGK